MAESESNALPEAPTPTRRAARSRRPAIGRRPQRTGRKVRTVRIVCVSVFLVLLFEGPDVGDAFRHQAPALTFYALAVGGFGLSFVPSDRVRGGALLGLVVVVFVLLLVAAGADAADADAFVYVFAPALVAGGNHAARHGGGRGARVVVALGGLAALGSALVPHPTLVVRSSYGLADLVWRMGYLGYSLLGALALVVGGSDVYSRALSVIARVLVVTLPLAAVTGASPAMYGDVALGLTLFLAPFLLASAAIACLLARPEPEEDYEQVFA